ncbi:hypothetical protein [Sphingobacterium spiritivorum]|uniref:Uncharacterized protein n=1 Tax=Sphingobacterium spiritivorum ATCC 33861 TaxID=525373 RepID=D7VNJ9_SPHSI|nr:hypothetical protein [Sphingobacterium spiritivorum]EFK57496.1 hypothetical protein HMPREF0766_12569 [Sphingobacterium spiritivorum ATCC 33861]QQT24414.1 hypothetical protein I6J02_11630 [Sphingobacterium spiritivorum]QQT36439.1 hypothetical protein I6J01_03145 [Sphingobacterium spiritivorum]WQD33188.1 hypothetical protein U0038_16855 [Sphingobacterium spiritivorum]SUJ19295.1 Uncharacterised protein [Sphingobacterium spiritivorum]
MNYATQYHIGHHQNPTATETEDFAQTVGRVRRLDAKTKERRRNKKRQNEIGTDNGTTNGFLKCSFLPKLQEAQTVQACGKSEKTERDFYQSLSKLAGHYCIQPMQSRQYGYPYNIALALDSTEEQLRKKFRDWEELRLIQDSKKTYFVSEERYSTGATLYYIPVVPLYRLSKHPNRKQAVQLLQSVCAYLYHIADVPYYRQENSYLYWMYEMVTEWIVSDDENEDTTTYLSEIRQSEQIGERMEQKIYNKHNLSRFAVRLNSFKIKDSFDQDCYKLASEAFALYEQYPNATINRNALPSGEASEEDMENSIGVEKYVSFCADAKGILFQTLFESVNTELQEYGQMEEPTIVKRFDGSDITANTLEFENRVFALIEELIYILNNF